MSRSCASSSKPKPKLCRCGHVPIEKQSWTMANPGRRFYTCPVYDPVTKKSGCKWFDWSDGPQVEWQKEVIKEIMLDKAIIGTEVDRYKHENSYLLAENERLKEENKLLRVKAKIVEEEPVRQIILRKRPYSITFYSIVFVFLLLASVLLPRLY